MEQVTSGDYLLGFLQGTRRALWEDGRESITITVEKLDPATVWALIALFEGAVGLYASLVNINAYHQPGVEAGKKAAGELLKLQKEVFGFLRDNRDKVFTADEDFSIAEAVAIDGERMVAVGTSKDLRSRYRAARLPAQRDAPRCCTPSRPSSSTPST